MVLVLVSTLNTVDKKIHPTTHQGPMFAKQAQVPVDGLRGGKGWANKKC